MKKLLFTLGMVLLFAPSSWAHQQYTKVCYTGPHYRECYYERLHHPKFCRFNRHEEYYRGPRYCERFGEGCDRNDDYRGDYDNHHAWHDSDDDGFYVSMGHDYGDGYIKIRVKK